MMGAASAKYRRGIWVWGRAHARMITHRMLDDNADIDWPRPALYADDPTLDDPDELMADTKDGTKFPVNAWKRKRQEMWNALPPDVQVEWEETAIQSRPTLDDAAFK